MNKQKVLLIDGNSIINRAFFGLPTLTNKKGLYTNGIYGFLNIFFKLYEEENPNYVGVAFDLKGPTIRHQKFEDYKKHRKGMPEELVVQMPVLKDLLKVMNIQIFEKDGYEADDLLGTLAINCENKNYDVILVSGDRDLLQIATDNIKIRIPKTKAGKTEVEDYYKKDVIELIGVTPKEYIDVKALMGDTSDNIPGVPSIGEKTAIKIIKEYKNIENAIENYKFIKPARISENLIKNKDIAILSKELATIITNVQDLELEKEITKEDIFNQGFKKELLDLEFKSIVSKYFESSNQDFNDNIENYFDTELITTEKEIDDFFYFFQKDISNNLDNNELSLSLVNFLGKNVGVSLTFKMKKISSYFFMFTEELAKSYVFKKCKIFEDKNIIFFDSKKFLTESKLNLNPSFDVVLATYILNTNVTSFINDILNIDINIEDFEKINNKKSFEKLEKEQIKIYSGFFSYISFISKDILKEKLRENSQDKLYFEIELPLAIILSEMEIYGVKINRISLVDFDNSITLDIDRLTKEIYSLANEEFNINSPLQMGTILFEKLGLQGSKKTKTGYSTAADVLEKIKADHPIIEKILEYRTLTKLKTTYCEGLLALADPFTDKIHTTFNQTLTTTGRISSIEPNLQNIPVRMELGRQLRKVFTPTDDSYTFLDADYSQIELRIMAHLSKDENMINAYKRGDDIHKATAASVLGVPLESVTSKERNSAKAINFGILYGMGSFSLSNDLKITKKEAEIYIKKYFEKYPNIKKYLDEQVEFAKRNGYGITILGRRRNIPEINSKNFATKNFGERIAMNMPIQGSAADIMKIAMVRVYNSIKSQNLQSRIILTVHDELLVETKKTEIDVMKKILKEEMENAVELLVPLETEVKEGATWYDTK
ncbi:MAG: DNA polymerase I [Defluviitaleaceae bacterium]|nr:DNA polymerase I [Defluviitaleaceae bacterium]